MAGTVNKVILIGNVGVDPQIRSTQNGNKIANLSIATSESWKDKMSGERKEKTEWHRVVIFDERLADVVERFVTKGSKLYLEGQLQTRKWTDNNGIEKYTTEVVLQRFSGVLTMLDSKGSNSGGGYDGGGQSFGSNNGPDPSASLHSPSSNSSLGAPAFEAELDDDIPF